jgi:hypothetical protein
LLDESRAGILAENRMDEYAENAPGAIYWHSDDKKAVSPLELVRRADKLHTGLFRRAFTLLVRLDRESLEPIVGRVPTDWMTGTARRFAIEFVCHNLGKLKEIAP